MFKDIKKVKIQQGIFTEANNAPGWLLLDIFKRILGFLNIAFADPCCTIDPVNLPVKYNKTEAKVEFYDNISKSWESLVVDRDIKNIKTVSEDYSMIQNDEIIICITNSFTITLPNVLQSGLVYIIKNLSVGNNIIVTAGSNLIDNSNSKTLSYTESLTVVSNSSNYIIC